MNKPLCEGDVSTGTGLRLELFVEDMEATTSFYTRVLPFALERHEAGNYASLRSGSAILGIGPIAKLPEEGGYFTRNISSHQRGLGVEVVLEVDNVDQWHNRVTASGYPTLEPLQERPWGLREFLADPDGYHLRITSRSTVEVITSHG